MLPWNRLNAWDHRLFMPGTYAILLIWFYYFTKDQQENEKESSDALRKETLWWLHFYMVYYDMTVCCCQWAVRCFVLLGTSWPSQMVPQTNVMLEMSLDASFTWSLLASLQGASRADSGVCVFCAHVKWNSQIYRVVFFPCVYLYVFRCS